MDILLILLINIIAFVIPYIIIVVGYFADKHNIQFETALNFNDYVGETVTLVMVIQFIFFIINLIVFIYMLFTNYTLTDSLIGVTIVNLIVFEVPLLATTLVLISSNMSNIKKDLRNQSIKF